MLDSPLDLECLSKVLKLEVSCSLIKIPLSRDFFYCLRASLAPRPLKVHSLPLQASLPQFHCSMHGCGHQVAIQSQPGILSLNYPPAAPPRSTALPGARSPIDVRDQKDSGPAPALQQELLKLTGVVNPQDPCRACLFLSFQTLSPAMLGSPEHSIQDPLQSGLTSSLCFQT